MTELYAELLSAALVGTDRRTPALDSAPDELAKPLAALAGTEPAAALLSAAALATVYRRAGVRPVAGVPLPDPAPPEHRAEAPPSAKRRLATLLESEENELLHEWLDLADERGYRAPAALLPDLLDRGRRATLLREPIARVGGRRLRWLARQHKDWQLWSRIAAVDAPPDDNDWEFGDAGARLDHLRALRALHPDVARDKLAEAWSGEPADQRVTLLRTLRSGLAAADEPFLERALDDRSREVRITAAELLSVLPGSALRARLADRAGACLVTDRRWTRLAAPDESPELRRDLPHWRPDTSRNGLLAALLAAAPVETWRSRGPLDELLAEVHDRSGLLVDGMITAIVRESAVDAAVAMLPVLADSPDHSARYERLLPVLPPELRDERATHLLNEQAPTEPFAYQMLTQCPRPWSAELGVAALAWLRRHAARLGYQNIRWALLLGERLPVELLDEADRMVDEMPDDVAPALGRLRHLATIRHQMHKEFR